MIFISESILHKNNINDNFKKWFADSKITKGGKPLVCYHGTNDSDIKSFDESKIGHGSGNYGHYGYGFYFSTDVKEAKIYGPIIYQCYINIANPFTGSDEEIIQLKEKGVEGIDDLDVLSIDFESFKNSFKDKPYIFSFISDIQKLGMEKAWKNILKQDDNKKINYDLLNDISGYIEYTTLNKDVHGVPEYVLDAFKKLNINPKLNKGFYIQQSLHWITDLGNNSKEITNVIKELGHDGVWYGSEIVAFYPHQIKSVNNDGSWDINDSNIYS